MECAHAQEKKNFATASARTLIRTSTIAARVKALAQETIRARAAFAGVCCAMACAQTIRRTKTTAAHVEVNATRTRRRANPECANAQIHQKYFAMRSARQSIHVWIVRVLFLIVLTRGSL